MPIFTVRTDNKEIVSQSSILYLPQDSVLFKSQNSENAKYAKDHGVWQINKRATRAKIGTRVLVKDTESGVIYDIGEITDINLDTPPNQIEPWPNDNWPQ